MMGSGGEKQGVVSRGDRSRGVNAIVGLVILFGMVTAGVGLLIVVGSPMLDAFESESERERAHLCMEEADHKLATVAETGQQQSLPNGDLSECRLGVADDGRIDVTWYNSSTESPQWSNDTRTASADLGALEFRMEHRTIAHQGGGIWESSDGVTTVVSEPGISYDNDSVQFDIIQLDEDELGGSDPIAKPDPDKSAELAANVSAAAAASDGEDVAIRVESSYHEGWYRHFKSAFGADEYSHVNVTHEPANERVVANITGIRTVPDDPDVVIESDGGLDNTVGTNDQRVEYGDPLDFIAYIKNTGGSPANPGTTVSILGTSLSDTHNGAVPDGQTKDRGPQIGYGTYRTVLDPGRTYQYQYTLDNGESLDTPGTFYLGRSGTHFNVTDVQTRPSGGDNVTISADVHNQGVDNGTQSVEIDFDAFNVSSSQSLSLEYGADGTVEWVVNETHWPSGSHPFTIRTADDSESGTLSIGGNATGEGFIIREDYGVDDGPAVAGDQRVDATGSWFDIATAIENTDPTEDTQEIELTIPEAGVQRTEQLTLQPNASDVVAFDLDAGRFEAGTVYEYNVSTEDSAMADPGRFYVGEPGTVFDLSETNASSANDTITITTTVENVGLEEGTLEEATLDLEYLDGETPDAYDMGPTTVDETFGFGQDGTLEWQLNQSRLLDGEYEATVRVDGAASATTFNVTLGLDPGETGIGVDEPATANVSVLGSQVSRPPYEESCGWFCTEIRHDLIPVSLSVVTESDGERTVHHEFANDEGGDNINTYDTWQRKGTDEWTTQIEIEEEGNLTLASTSSMGSYGAGCPDAWRRTEENDTVHRDCTDVNRNDVWVDIDATTGSSLQNVRVRDHERNTIPALRAAHGLQLSADEVLEREGLWDRESGTLDLEENEYIFLFEVTSQTDDEDIDALWEQAQNTDGHGDPNFNDLIVHVEVERANVDVSNPYITLVPEQSDQTDVGNGGGNTDGDDGAAPGIDAGGSASGDSPDLGTGTPDSNPGGSSGSDVDTGLEMDPDHIVIG